MKRDIEIRMNSIYILSNIQRTRDMFDKEFRKLESYESGLDYEKWSDSFHAGMVEASESVKKVFAEIIELEVNKSVGGQ